MFSRDILKGGHDAANRLVRLFRANANVLLMLFATLLLPAFLAWGSTSGSISGTVKDSVGKVVQGAAIHIREASTGAIYEAQSDNKGHYTLPVLPVGHYELEIQAPGFSVYQRTDIVLDTNAALTEDATLAVGNISQSVSVTDDALHVETVNSQMGEVITGSQMTSVPLDMRSYTDLLALQPGVAPETSITSDTVQDVGATVLSPSGTLNPGTISVNGQREFANVFIVNGSNAEEDVNEGTAIIPNLDSIAEFRVITNNFDAEYGEFSGGQIHVVTKSGTNNFHGGIFEFLRNTDLDARNYFSPTRGEFVQNQFGGTFGGPILHDKLFFFTDYQGTRQTQGIDTGNISVPSATDRTGNLTDLSSQLSGIVSGPYFANQLTQELGYAVVAGEPYYVAGCASPTQCVFPNATIPQRAWSGPGANCCSTSRRRIRPVAPLRPRPSIRRSATTRVEHGLTSIAVGVLPRPITSSIISLWTILIPLRRAEPAFPASMRLPTDALSSFP